MAGAVTGLHVFAADTGPEALSLLDGNFSPLATAFNTLANFSNSYIDSGAVNGLVITVNAPQVVAYVDGLIVQVKVAATSTSATPTININAMGAKAIVNPNGSALAVGALAIASWVTLQYEATSGKFMLIAGSSAASFATGTFGDGAANAPSITFTSDPTTGIYKAGALTLGFATNGVARGSINGTGLWSLAAPTSGSPTLTVNGSTGYLQQWAGTNTFGVFISGATPGVQIGTVNNSALGLFTNNGAVAVQVGTSNISNLQAIDDGGTMQVVGWRDCPQNIQTTNYQLALSDRGKQIFMNATGIQLTIPANASVPFPIGTTILVCAGGGGSITVAIAGADTLFFAGIGATGTRTLAAFGMATLTKVLSGGWFIAGSGVS